MPVMSAVNAAGATHPGRHRDVNEDRYHVDVGRGIFFVVDGVGGQAAGGKAADTAAAVLRARLERETGPLTDRVREAITAANNEIYRLASLRPEWSGMACVLTVAVLDDGFLVVGHVGDTRLYTIRQGRIEKATRDHSPVGEREDAGELSELEAMRSPRRNEVYRDVGSEPHEPGDSGFIDLFEIPFEPDSALLICSDGLTDLVPSASIHEIVAQRAGRPDAVSRALVAAANDAGGTDNISVVYVEGDRFASDRTRPLSSRRAEAAPRPGRRWIRIAAIALMTILLAAPSARLDRVWLPIQAPAFSAEALPPGTLVVGPTESIMAAVAAARPGIDVVVERGEYRERIHLKDGVRLLSRERRGAVIRLPSDAGEHEAAVVADGVSATELRGFRIVGDAATPLGTGLLIRNASVAVSDVEIAGAARRAIDIHGVSGGDIVGSDIHDNPGAALRVGSGASPRIAHTSFVRNGASAASRAMLLEAGAQPRFSRNVFQGIAPAAFAMLDERTRASVLRENWFIEAAAARDPSSGSGRSR